MLRAAVNIYDRTGHDVRARDIEAALGFDKDTVQRALRALNREPSFQDVVDSAQGVIAMGCPPAGDALCVAGAWPSPENLLERLIAALENAANDDTREPEERSKLKQAAS